jgi:NAD(P)-dependent dehydrogenase (short-subunit alcohol dehydrogenase family)
MILDRTPSHRWGKVDETAGTAVFLASQAADFITGVTLPVVGSASFGG